MDIKKRKRGREQERGMEGEAERRKGGEGARRRKGREQKGGAGWGRAG